MEEEMKKFLIKINNNIEDLAKLYYSKNQRYHKLTNSISVIKNKISKNELQERIYKLACEKQNKNQCNIIKVTKGEKLLMILSNDLQKKEKTLPIPFKFTSKYEINNISINKTATSNKNPLYAYHNKIVEKEQNKKHKHPSKPKLYIDNLFENNNMNDIEEITKNNIKTIKDCIKTANYIIVTCLNFEYRTYEKYPSKFIFSTPDKNFCLDLEVNNFLLNEIEFPNNRIIVNKLERKIIKNYIDSAYEFLYFSFRNFNVKKNIRCSNLLYIDWRIKFNQIKPYIIDYLKRLKLFMKENWQYFKHRSYNNIRTDLKHILKSKYKCYLKKVKKNFKLIFGKILTKDLHYKFKRFYELREYIASSYDDNPEYILSTLQITKIIEKNPKTQDELREMLPFQSPIFKLYQNNFLALLKNKEPAPIDEITEEIQKLKMN